MNAQFGPMRRTASDVSARHLHLIADDLTGALDAAAQFVRAIGPIDVHWRSASPAGNMALDSGTREMNAEQAGAVVTKLVSSLPNDPSAVNFAKLDSLLRGSAAAEIAAWHQVIAFDYCLIVPAFPHQGRVTRGGRQYYRRDDHWIATRTDLACDLERLGIPVSLCRPGDDIPRGVSLWDAETDQDLILTAALGLTLKGRVLWCGSGGLAGALTEVMTDDGKTSAAQPHPFPLLGLFGTDHPVTAEQIAACGPLATTLPDGGEASADEVTRRLRRDGSAIVRIAIPEGTSRPDAAALIDHELGALVHRLASPATLLVAGGETLRALCLALGTDHLELVGQLMPGIPRSFMRGGRFDGTEVISKSGAFGDRELLKRLATPASLSQ